MNEPSVSSTSPPATTLSILAILLVSRLGLFVIAYMGLALLPGSRLPSDGLPGNLLLDGWVRWDGIWYARIAREGYTNVPRDDSGQRDAAFMPLYPLATRAAAWVCGDVFIGGLLVSNTASILAGVLLFRLVEWRWNSDLAKRTLILTCVYPFSYTFSAMYPESLFLLCSVAAFWMGEKRWWPAAAICAAAAGATRVYGIAGPIALCVMYLQTISWKLSNLKWSSLWLLLGFAGTAAHPIYFGWRFDEPLALFNVHTAKGWGDWNNWRLLGTLYTSWRGTDFDGFAAGHAPVLLTLHLFVCLVAAVLCIVGWKRLPIAYSVWTTVVLTIAVFPWASFGRHFATAFPAFIVAAQLLRGPRLYHGLLYLSVLLLALLTILFTHAAWVA